MQVKLRAWRDINQRERSSVVFVIAKYRYFRANVNKSGYALHCCSAHIIPPWCHSGPVIFGCALSYVILYTFKIFSALEPD